MTGKIYIVTAAFDVSCYVTREIEAESDEEALQKLKALDEDLWSHWDPEYESADNHRIVEIAVDDDVIVEQLQIDSDEWRAI